MLRRLQEVLRLAGLTEDEVVLYVHLLRLKRATMAELIGESGRTVMTAYRVMKRLQDRGLVQAININRKQSVYLPLTLKGLIDKLDTQQRTLRRTQLALQDLGRFLPFLDVPDTLSDRHRDEEMVEVREGKEAFREEYLKLPDLCDDEFLCMGSMQNYWQVAGMSDEAPEELAFRHKRFRKGMFCRIFNTHSRESEIFSRRDSKELRTTRIVDTLPVARDYVGFSRDHVCHFICNPEQPRVIIIRHPEMVALYRDQFERMWGAGVGA